MDEPSLCPVCNKKLEWKQINLKEAAEICIDLKCPFPVGSKCRVRQRALKNIRKIPKAPVPKVENGVSQDELMAAQQFDLDAFLSEVQENM